MIPRRHTLHSSAFQPNSLLPPIFTRCACVPARECLVKKIEPLRVLGATLMCNHYCGRLLQIWRRANATHLAAGESEWHDTGEKDSPCVTIFPRRRFVLTYFGIVCGADYRRTPNLLLSACWRWLFLRVSETLHSGRCRTHCSSLHLDWICFVLPVRAVFLQKKIKSPNPRTFFFFFFFFQTASLLRLPA